MLFYCKHCKECHETKYVNHDCTTGTEYENLQAGSTIPKRIREYSAKLNVKVSALETNVKYAVWKGEINCNRSIIYDFENSLQPFQIHLGYDFMEYPLCLTKQGLNDLSQCLLMLDVIDKQVRSVFE